MVVLSLLACSGDTPAWAVHHASLIPTSTGISGTQTWEMFSGAWAASGSADDQVCARAQLVTGGVVAAPAGCSGCLAAYDLSYTELESDCAAPLDTDVAFATPAAIGIGDVASELADLDPWPGRSLGWYLSIDGVEMEAYGFAYPEGLEYDGEVGSPGWTNDQIYTLWPAFAWDLRE